MLAALLNKSHDITLVDYPLKKIEPDQLLVKIGACGVCGTDFHIFKGEAPAKPPVILGHEYAGEIVEIGSHVKGFSIEDKVAINPNIHCGYCEFCKSGKINLCKNLKALGVTINGGLAQYGNVPLSQAHLLPKDSELKHAAFAEPLSCCIHGIEQANIKLGDKVAVIGAGTIGLLMIQLARLKGSSQIIVLDPVLEKRKVAIELNADYSFDPFEVDTIAKIKEITSGGADVVIECVGNQDAAQTSIEIAKRGGTVVIFGLSGKESYLKFNLQIFFHNELTIKSSLLNPYTFQTAVDLLITKQIKVELFRTHYFTFKDQELISIFRNNIDRSINKYMLIPNG